MKDIWTWTRLLDKTKRLAKHNLSAYRELRTDGLIGMTGDYHISVKARNSEGLVYTMAWGGQPFCRVYPVAQRGKMYSVYQTRFTKTGLRKAMLDALPVELPSGIASNGVVVANFLNADGSVAKCGSYSDQKVGRKRRNKTQDRGVWSDPIIIDDQTGQFVTSPMAWDLSVKAINYEQCADLAVGFLPGTSNCYSDWLDSMSSPNVPNFDWVMDGGVMKTTELPGPLWDGDAVKDLARRVMDAAKQFMDHAPHCKLALYPGMMRPYEVQSFWDLGLSWIARFENDDARPTGDRRCLVVGRDSTGCPIMWYPPSLVLYWTTSIGDSLAARWIKVTLPPVGCKNLNPDDLGSSSWSRKTRDTAAGQYVQNRHRERMVAIERAYHGMACAKNRHPGNYLYVGGVVPPTDKEYQWSEHSTMVMVEDNHELGWPRKDYQTYACPPYAATPESAFRLYEETEILEALPVC